MNENLLNTVNYYCENEIDAFKNSELFKEVNTLVNKLNYTLACEYCNAIENKSECFFLTITVFDTNNEEIEIFDEGSLEAFTRLIEIDERQRVKFYSWSDDEFIDDLKWIIGHLNSFSTNSIRNRKLSNYNKGNS